MSHRVAIDLARLRLPAGAAFTVAPTPAGVEAETSQDQKDVTIADINRDPLSFSLFSVIEESIGGELPLQETGLAQDVARRSTAIVSPVVELGMTATIFVGLVEQPIGGSDRSLDLPRSKKRCACFPILLQVDRTHEFIFVLDGALSPLLRAATAHESEGGEEKDDRFFH